MPSNRYIFDHITKTAGTSLFSTFQELVGRDAVLHVRNGTTAEQTEHALRKKPLTIGGGHLKFRPGHHVPADIRYITFLRDPVERALSVYYSARLLAPPTRGSYVDQAKTLELEEFFHSESRAVRDMIADHYTRHFATCEIGAADPLKSAKQRLEEYFFVGMSADLEDSVLVLCALAGWPPASAIPRLNVSRHLRPEIPDSVRARIEAINASDRELYQYGQSLFSQKRSAVIRRFAAQGRADLPSVPAEVATTPPQTVSSGALPPATGVSFGTSDITLFEARVLRGHLEETRFASGEVLRLRIGILARVAVADLSVGLAIHDSEGRLVFGTNLNLLSRLIALGAGDSYICQFKVGLRLAPGDYQIGVSAEIVRGPAYRCVAWIDPVARFSITGFAARAFDGAADLPCAVTIVDGPRLQPLQNFAGTVDIASRAADGSLLVRVRNKGRDPWPHDGPAQVRVGCRWLDADGRPMELEGARASLRFTLPGGATTETSLVPGEAPAGATRCRITLVQEGVAWFDQMNGPFLDLPVTLAAPP